MPISVQQIRAEFTQDLIAVYRDQVFVPSFLRGLCTTKTSPTRYVSIEVERGTEKIAVDVLRGTKGNRNTFSRSTLKSMEAPYFREYFDATELDLYQTVLGAQRSGNTALYSQLVEDVASRIASLRGKIERKKELMVGQMLSSGVITLVNGDNIDFKRKAASMVDLGSDNYFANDVDVFKVFEEAGRFLKKTGKASSPIFNAILGEEALTDLFNNKKFLARQNLVNLNMDAIQGSARDVNTGADYYGQISAGPYKIQLWSYAQYYEDPDNGNQLTPYINPKEVAVIPKDPRFIMSHGAVPQLLGEPGQMPNQGEFVVGDYIDERLATHEYDIQSAPIAIPVAVDQIYTFKAKA